MREVKCKIFVDNRKYVNNGPINAAPWTVLEEDGLETIILATGHFLSYSNLSEDEQSQMAILTYIDVCNDYDIHLLGVPTDLKTIE